jgi:hypothetical protein
VGEGGSTRPLHFKFDSTRPRFHDQLRTFAIVHGTYGIDQRNVPRSSQLEYYASQMRSDLEASNNHCQSLLMAKLACCILVLCNSKPAGKELEDHSYNSRPVRVHGGESARFQVSFLIFRAVARDTDNAAALNSTATSTATRTKLYSRLPLALRLLCADSRASSPLECSPPAPSEAASCSHRHQRQDAMRRFKGRQFPVIIAISVKGICADLMADGTGGWLFMRVVPLSTSTCTCPAVPVETENDSANEAPPAMRLATHGVSTFTQQSVLSPSSADSMTSSATTVIRPPTNFHAALSCWSAGTHLPSTRPMEALILLQVRLVSMTALVSPVLVSRFLPVPTAVLIVDLTATQLTTYLDYHTG